MGWMKWCSLAFRRRHYKTPSDIGGIHFESICNFIGKLLTFLCLHSFASTRTSTYSRYRHSVENCQACDAFVIRKAVYMQHVIKIGKCIFRVLFSLKMQFNAFFASYTNLFPVILNCNRTFTIHIPFVDQPSGTEFLW